MLEMLLKQLGCFSHIYCGNRTTTHLYKTRLIRITLLRTYIFYTPVQINTVVAGK